MRKGLHHHAIQYFVSVVLTLFLWQCGTNTTPSGSKCKESSDLSGILIADTILYPVTIINPDSLDTWADRRLKRLNHQTLMNSLFEALYDGKITAYDYYDRTPVTADSIREMESTGLLKREEIAQLQFEESWFFDSKAGSLSKKVNSILLALPVYNDQNNIKGYKATFVVKLNSQ